MAIGVLDAFGHRIVAMGSQPNQPRHHKVYRSRYHAYWHDDATESSMTCTQQAPISGPPLSSFSAILRRAA